MPAQQWQFGVRVWVQFFELQITYLKLLLLLVDPRVKIDAAGLLEKLMIQLAHPSPEVNEVAIGAALKRLEPNASATGARYDLLAIPQDTRDRSILLIDFVTTNEASAVW